MARISATVGPGAVNRSDDVLVVQLLLERHKRWLGGASLPEPNGRFTPETESAILGFQRNGAALLRPDGIVKPNDFSFTRLNLPFIAGPRHRIFNGVCWAHDTGSLTDADYARAAKALDCDAAAVQAVADTEARESAWDLWNRPIILFERHKFAKHTHGRFNATHPDISSSAPGGYSRFEYERLRRAAMLDEAAALKSASWGLFQILGENHRLAGFASVDAFVDAMMVSSAEHLNAFVHFVRSQAALKRAIENKDWPAFARSYNGPSYAKNDYDGKMRRAYLRLSSLRRR